MVQILMLYSATTAIFFAIDMLWLGVIAKTFYRNQLGTLIAPQINWVAGVSFYLIFLVGLLFFAVYPAIEGGSWKTALALGALFGFFSYATYDLTNLATLRDWPLLISLVDMAWGTFLGGSVALLSFLVSRFIY